MRTAVFASPAGPRQYWEMPWRFDSFPAAYPTKDLLNEEGLGPVILHSAEAGTAALWMPIEYAEALLPLLAKRPQKGAKLRRLARKALAEVG